MLMLGANRHSVPTPPVHPQRVSLWEKVSLTFTAPTKFVSEAALWMLAYATPPVTYNRRLSTTTPVRVLMVPNDLTSLLTVKVSKAAPTPLSVRRCVWSSFDQLKSVSKPRTTQP